MEAIQHIHHISAIVGNPEENIRFYRDVLNLKLIKKTVNYDDPSTYHLYFLNGNIENGTILTFSIGQMHIKVVKEMGKSNALLLEYLKTQGIFGKHIYKHIKLK